MIAGVFKWIFVQKELLNLIGNSNEEVSISFN